jgi:uncharacterized protein YjbJ (UPF0337 family)
VGSGVRLASFDANLAKGAGIEADRSDRKSASESPMSEVDKAVGKAKEAIAKIVGDDALARQGRAQKAAKSAPATPAKEATGGSAQPAASELDQESDFDPEKVVYYP